MDYARDPNLGLSEKWRMFKEEKSRRGGKSAYYLNKWVPWYFYSVLFGAYAWYALAAVPAHHFRDPVWYAINEMFGLYVEMQLLVNWLLIHKTDSSYKPSTIDSATLLLEDSVSSYDPAHFQGEPTPSGDSESGKHPPNGSLPTEASWPSRRRTGLTYQMNVATAVTSGGEVQRRAYPYWSWVPCLWCRRLRPPRCHHCMLCGCCVLKRDHHCYFTRVCIGINNQRHFLVFLFWSIVMTSLASCELLPYTAKRVFSIYSYWNILFPVNVVSALSGQLPVSYLHLILMVWSLILLFFISLGMFSVHLFCTMRGVTKFEYDHGIILVDTRSPFSRFKGVMGRNWGLVVLLPGYVGGPPQEDGIKWPYVRP